jgi:voltage-gated potassium channel
MTPLPMKRMRAGLITLGVIFLVGVFGYWMAGWELLDSIYMVVVTLSTVGYREVNDLTPALQIFTCILIVFGVSTALYIMGGLLQMMFEGEINRALGMRRVSREIERLRGHIVICGFGRMGEILASELERQKKEFVVVESDSDRIAEATALNYLAINDDSTEEESLEHAGVHRAKTLVTTLPRDADNVFITLTARNLNADLQIIARGEYESTEKKLLQAGANRVVLPAATGALRMAAMITRPSAVELIEVVAGRQIGEVDVDEFQLPEESPLVGTTVRDSQAGSRHALLIVAIRRSGGELEFNPPAHHTFETGDSIIVMGRLENIEGFRSEHKI